MITPVSKESVIGALQECLVEHCGEIVEIQQSGVAFYGDPRLGLGDHRMVTYRLRDMTAYEVVSADESFVNECLAHIERLELSCFTLYLPSWYSLPPSLFKEYTIEKTSTHADLILPKDYSCEALSDRQEIRLLEEEDRRLADGFLLPEALPGRPDFDVLFRAIVLQKSLPGGKIFAYIKDGRIVAYLSCYLFEQGIYDIDHVYVLPAYRKQGLGSALVQQYITSTLADGDIPRYGNAENHKSRALAKKAGFVEVKCQDKYILKKGGCET